VENRQHQRAPVDLPVEIAIKASDARIQGRAVDLSLGGMFVRTAHPQPFGAEVVVHAALTANKAPFELAAVVRWVRDDGMGLQFRPVGARETHAIMELTRQL
jgi:c-di-GMP-binding flagellar brake protein YcgR